MAHRRCGFVDSRLRRCPPDRASAVPHGQAGENALRFPHLAHRSAAVHKLYSAPTTARIEFDSGKGVTFNRQPALAYSSRDLSKQPGPPQSLIAGVNLRLYVTNTLGNPEEEKEYIPHILKPLAASRREANKIKRQEPITVVIGNPPYKEKAKGKGGWIESGSGGKLGPLALWIPPTAWGVSAHTKHLRNLYIYFWRWATWKVFGDGAPTPQTAPDRKGVVCFITVAGFLNGPGFEAMRDYLRRTADDIWVIDCSPDGHQPDVPTRIFEGVQQPVCIVLVARTGAKDPKAPAAVRHAALPVGPREAKFEALAKLSLATGWADCPTDWRAPFLPRATGGWATYSRLDELFSYNGSGVMPGRTWVIAPDKKTLEDRWDVLIAEKDGEKKEVLFHPHYRGGDLGDKYAGKVVYDGLTGHKHRDVSVAKDSEAVIEPTRYGYRSFDRQWIIPDSRVINQPNPTLWDSFSKSQIFATALMRHSPSSGPAITFTALIPDHDHYRGSFAGRVFPLWSDAAAKTPNVSPSVIGHLSTLYGQAVSADDFFAYIAAIAAHPEYTSMFGPDLIQPSLRIPITANADLFIEGATLGKTVIWLHTFGERYVSASDGRPAGPPRLPPAERPTNPKGGTIPSGVLPSTCPMTYRPAASRLTQGISKMSLRKSGITRSLVSEC